MVRVDIPGPRRVGLGRRLAAALVVTCACALMWAAPASALEITSPKTDYLEDAQLSVTLESTDATGMAVVSIDGFVVDSRPVVPGQTYDLKDVHCRNGGHEATVVLRSRGGVTASEPVEFTTWARAQSPTLITPKGYTGRYADFTARVGGSTTSLALYLNGKLITTKNVMPYTVVSLGRYELAQGQNQITLVASNPVNQTKAGFVVTRLDYPWPTCIIIDKSDFKLYWVRNGTLVKAYPVAIGKPSTPTPSAIWRIDAKYITDPAGVYGPRKMRLFRQTSSGYVYTAYGIHGTNEPWVIGTMASHGCIRMYNSDVLELYPQVPLGTMVQTRP